jgi:hypothetical protein
MIAFISFVVWLIGAVIFFSLLLDTEDWVLATAASVFWPLGVVIAMAYGATGTISEIWVAWKSRQRLRRHSPDEVRRE